jgi:hypothetical protein
LTIPPPLPETAAGGIRGGWGIGKGHPMKLVISIDLGNAAFEEGGAEEVGRILASVAERIPDPLRPSDKLSLHDANGNYCGEAVIIAGRTAIVRTPPKNKR